MTTHSTRQAESVLVIDDEPSAAQLIKYLMEASGYSVRVASNADQAIDAIRRQTPDLIISDVEMPGTNGIDFTRWMRNDPRLAGLLVLMVTARNTPADKLAGLAAGADDYIVKPFEPAELIARAHTLLRRARELRSQSPLTGLPGNQRIDAELDSRIEARDPFALLYADLDHFKAYNDCYGFSAGDRAIRTTAWMLQDVARELDSTGSFVGHIGGDDFVIMTRSEFAAEIAKAVIERFDHEVTFLYSEDDAARGWIETLGRQGEMVRFPLLTISIGIATASSSGSSRSGLVKAASEMKAVAKRTLGSGWAVDQRDDGRSGQATEAPAA